MNKEYKLDFDKIEKMEGLEYIKEKIHLALVLAHKLDLSFTKDEIELYGIEQYVK